MLFGVCCLCLFGQTHIPERKVIRYIETAKEYNPTSTNVKVPMYGSNHASKNSAEIVIEYNQPISDSFKVALNNAKEIWESTIPIQQSIYISVGFEPLDSDIISEAEAVHYNDENYIGCPSALLSQLTNHQNGLPDSTDGAIIFNSNINWNCSLTEDTTNKYDLTTFALRGIAHCLGFGGSICEVASNDFIYSLETPSYFDKLLRSNGLMMTNLKEGSAELADFVTSDNVYLQTNNRNYKVYAPKVFKPFSSLCFLEEDNTLMSYSIGEGNTFRYIDEKTIDILKTIGWEFPITGLEIECLDSYGREKNSAYLSHSYKLSKPNESIQSYSWKFSLRNKLGIYEQVSTGNGESFEIGAIENPENYYINNAGEVDGKIDCQYMIGEKSYNAVTYQFQLDLKPMILSIDNDLREDQPEMLFTYSFDVRYIGSDHVDVEVTDENSFIRREFTFSQPQIAHIRIEKMDALFKNWVDVIVENKYGQDKQTIVIGGNTGINSIENEAEDKYIQIYDLNGNPAFVGSKSQLSDLKKGIYIQKEIEINGKVKTYKILVR